MANYKELVPFILKWEGGYCNNKNDGGGATNKGVTLATFRQYYGKDKTAADLKKITNEQWMHIFKVGYWDQWHADDITSQSVANMLVDWLWHSGSYGIRLPQKVLKVEIDGVVGSRTIAAVNAADPKELFGKLKQERLDFFDRLCTNSPKNRTFLQGWRNRVNALKYAE